METNQTLTISHIQANSNKLRANKTFKNLYDIIFSNQSSIACYFTENGSEKSYTYADYEQYINRFTSHIQRTVGKQHKGRYIGIALDTCPLWPAVFWGILKAGYHAVLFNFAAPADILRNLILESNAVAIVSDKKRGLDIAEITLEELRQESSVSPDFQEDFADKIALCTSGTTGNSRIFVYDGNAICNQVLSSEILYDRCKRIVDNKPRKSLAFLPYHHVFGFLTGVLWIAFIGYINVYIPDRAPNTILEACNKYKINLLITVPILANNICVGLEKKLQQAPAAAKVLFNVLKGLSLNVQRLNPEGGIQFAKNVLFKKFQSKLLGPDIECIILGGSHTPTEHLKTLSALGYYTVCGFGMTETAINSVETDLSLKKRLLGSVGMPLSNIEYRIKPIGNKNNVGEMLIKGETLHIGMLKNGELTAPERVDSEWFPTGDIVRIEKDSRVYVEGRCKDIIINESGENVYPDEIEDHFSKLENIEQFSIVGIKKDKNSPYEDIALIINIGAKYHDKDFIAALQNDVFQINSTLSAVKRITRCILTSSPLPLVNGIKVKRLELKSNIENNKFAYKDLLLKGSTAVVEKQPEPEIAIPTTPSSLEMDEIKHKLIKIYAEVLDMPEDKIQSDAHFIDDLGGDSLQVLSIALKTEDAFSVTIPVEQYPQCATVNDLASLLYSLVRGNVSYERSTQPTAREIVPVTKFGESKEYIAFKERQQMLLSHGLENPYFVVHDSTLLDTSKMNGQDVLNFGSYNYVGMSGRKEVNEAAIKAIEQYGTSASGSRLLAGEKQIHRDLEKTIAAFKNSEDAIVLVGGHSTNVTFVGNFCGKNDLILYDALAHNSIEQGCKLSESTSKPFPHNDPQALEQLLRLHRHKYEKVLIIIEGAYSMDGDIANVPAFVALKKKYGCFLLVDEAHSACVIGKNGGGVDEYFGLAHDDIDIKMGTLSKGIGTCGGYLAGTKELIEYLRYNLPGFVFSVGISPALAAAAQEAILQLKKNPSIMENLHRNIKCFVEEAAKHEFNICLAGETAIIPILVGSDENAFLLSNLLAKHGVFVPPAVYPAVPKNKARLRFCVISEHKPEQIAHALNTLQSLVDQLGIVLPKPGRV